MDYKTFRVRQDRAMTLEKAAIEISYKTGQIWKWTDVANMLFENYLDDMKKDVISAAEHKKDMMENIGSRKEYRLK
jgi:glutamine cyclotransferase